MTRTLVPAHPILVVDDEPGVLTSIKITLRQAGLNHVLLCQDSTQALQMAAGREVAAVLLDLYMPRVPGEEILQRLSADFPAIPVIVVTGAVDVETAVECMKLGAFDYITKPVEPGPLVAAVNRALRFKDLQMENLSLRQQLLEGSASRHPAFERIITNDPGMLAIFRYLEAIAPSRQPVLITGETGVGKELAAEALYRLSQCPGELVIVNVAGLDDQVFSDTLFGHLRGAFTGADRSRRGMVKKAAGGTLVLDEIGDLPAASQVKLLRLLQNGEYQALGQDEVQSADVRIVATTNRDLRQMQNSGDFRTDLHYRLLTHHVHLPPLRERPGDIALLVDHFLEQSCRELGKRRPRVPPESLELLAAHRFPGNVRELRSLIHDAVSRNNSAVLSPGLLRDHLGDGQAPRRPDPGPATAGDQMVFPDELPTIKEATDMLVAEALRRSGGKQSEAARLLGISPPALSKRLKK